LTILQTEYGFDRCFGHINSEGYLKIIPEAVSGLMQQLGITL
jgi:hypothetical protein